MKKKMSFHNNILIINIGIFAALTVFFLAAFGSMFLWMKLPGRNWAVAVIGVLFVLCTLVLMGVFYRKVYTPIRNLEKAIYLLETFNDEEHLDFDSGDPALVDRLTLLISHLKNSLEEEHQKEILSQQSKFAELQSQINPHFLYNTLESIRGLAVIDDNYKIADMTEALAKYFRYNISLDEDKVPLCEELDNIRNYVHIQQYRFEDRFDFAIYCHDTSRQCMNAIIPKMTLQPIVENAIYHGVENQVEKGHISIHVESTDQVVMITIADDGSGMDEETLEQLNRKINGGAGTGGSGMAGGGARTGAARAGSGRGSSGMSGSTQSGSGRGGSGMSGSAQNGGGKSGSGRGGRHNGVAMANINQRIKLLFGDDYGMYVTSTPGCGTEVEVRVPMITAEEAAADSLAEAERAAAASERAIAVEHAAAGRSAAAQGGDARED